MTVNRRVGFQFTLKVDPLGSTSYTTLGAVIDGFKRSGAKRETPDTAILSDTWKTKGLSQGEPGEMTFSILYDPDETTTSTLTAMLNQTSQVAPNWQINYPSGSGGSGTIVAETFKGFLSSMSQEIKVDQKVMCDITISMSGDPGFYHA